MITRKAGCICTHALTLGMCYERFYSLSDARMRVHLFDSTVPCLRAKELIDKRN